MFMNNSAIKNDDNAIDLENILERIRQLEDIVETGELYYYSMKVRKRCVEELLEDACIREFGITVHEFRGSWVQPSSQRGVKRTVKLWGAPGGNDVKQSIVDAQRWFMSIMQNVLHRNTFSMKINYPFFDTKKVLLHRPVFLAALNPNPVDNDHKKNRAIFLSIMKRTRQMMREESVFDDALEGF